MGPRLSMLIGLIFGYIEAFGYLSRLELGANTATIWENKALLKRFASWKGKQWIFNITCRFYCRWWSFGWFHFANVTTFLTDLTSGAL
jgi:hypothetical protein